MISRCSFFKNLFDVYLSTSFSLHCTPTKQQLTQCDSKHYFDEENDHFSQFSHVVLRKNRIQCDSNQHSVGKENGHFAHVKLSQLIINVIVVHLFQINI